ncbi:hypothetical protein EDC04DRAFT_3140889 [Pisolithus marmoratus]|nr:hypothetical protein EDC04DRAFT_3140889 [Pisolithus marmoratus]
MPWSEHVILQFEFVNKFTTDDNEYYGPFYVLLAEFFPPTEGYQISPIPRTQAFPFMYVITIIAARRQVPILFVEIKNYIAHDDAVTREQADEQMRLKFLDFVEGSMPIPKLYGISALGTQICVYEYTAEDHTLTPERILPHPPFVTDIAPKERWNLDIMEPEGETRLKEVVSHIREMVSELLD